MNTDNLKIYILQKELSPCKVGTEFIESFNSYETVNQPFNLQLPKQLVEALPEWFKIKQDKIFTLHDAENIFTDSRLRNPTGGFKYDTFLDYMKANYGNIPSPKTYLEPWDRV